MISIGITLTFLKIKVDQKGRNQKKVSVARSACGESSRILLETVLGRTEKKNSESILDLHAIRHFIKPIFIRTEPKFFASNPNYFELVIKFFFSLHCSEFSFSFFLFFSFFFLASKNYISFGTVYNSFFYFLKDIKVNNLLALQLDFILFFASLLYSPLPRSCDPKLSITADRFLQNKRLLIDTCRKRICFSDR